MDKVFTQIWHRKFAFLGTFFLIFLLTYLVFVAIDFLPESPAETESTPAVSETMATATSGPSNVQEAEPRLEPVEADRSDVSVEPILPTKLSIDRLDRTVPVLNPQSRTIADLDAALLEGTVRHPDSANLAQDGNVFILGHSSYLPNVLNRNFQAFNGIQNLEWGDTIEVYSEETIFEYRVEKVYRAQAQDVTVPIAGTGKMLTLATCNSFGSVDDRYIVEAKQTGERPRES
jgi:LPXTG-site transpeptidase (sortase) family protein